jgi:hypothetical protein
MKLKLKSMSMFEIPVNGGDKIKGLVKVFYKEASRYSIQHNKITKIRNRWDGTGEIFFRFVSFEEDGGEIEVQ